MIHKMNVSEIIVPVKFYSAVEFEFILNIDH